MFLNVTDLDLDIPSAPLNKSQIVHTGNDFLNFMISRRQNVRYSTKHIMLFS